MAWEWSKGRNILSPIFGPLSVLAKNTPIYIYDHPKLKEISNSAISDGVNLFICVDLLKELTAEHKTQPKTDGLSQLILAMTKPQLADTGNPAVDLNQYENFMKNCDSKVVNSIFSKSEPNQTYLPPVFQTLTDTVNIFDKIGLNETLKHLGLPPNTKDNLDKIEEIENYFAFKTVKIPSEVTQITDLSSYFKQNEIREQKSEFRRLADGSELAREIIVECEFSDRKDIVEATYKNGLSERTLGWGYNFATALVDNLSNEISKITVGKTESEKNQKIFRKSYKAFCDVSFKKFGEATLILNESQSGFACSYLAEQINKNMPQFRNKSFKSLKEMSFATRTNIFTIFSKLDGFHDKMEGIINAFSEKKYHNTHDLPRKEITEKLRHLKP